MTSRQARKLYQAGQYRQSVEMIDRLIDPARATSVTPEQLSALELAVDVNRASGTIRTCIAIRPGVGARNSIGNYLHLPASNLKLQLRRAKLAVADLQMSLKRPADAEKTLVQVDRIGCDAPRWRTGLGSRSASTTGRAIAAEGKDEQQRAAKQWAAAETQCRDAVEDCRQRGSPPKDVLAAVKLQVECLLALDRAADGVAVIEQSLARVPDDDPTKSEFYSELARIRHAQANLPSEREALTQAIDTQKKVRPQPMLDRSGKTLEPPGIRDRCHRR